MHDLNLALCHCHKTRREEVHIRVDGEDLLLVGALFSGLYCTWLSTQTSELTNPLLLSRNLDGDVDR